MTYEEIIEAVNGSDRDDWNKITCGGTRGGPSYRDGVDGATHPYVAVLKEDASITIAWGLGAGAFNEAWLRNFPDQAGHASQLDIFYNGALVHRETYIDVDGGRGMVPLPTAAPALNVTQQQSDLIRLLNSMTVVTDYDDTMRRAGITVA